MTVPDILKLSEFSDRKKNSKNLKKDIDIMRKLRYTKYRSDEHKIINILDVR